MALTDALYSLFSYFVQWHKDNYQTLHGKNTIDAIYPLGSIYITTNNSNPSNLFPGTTWAQLTDTFLYAVDSGNADTDKTKPPEGQGSKNAVVVSHNHTQQAHSHNCSNHTHNMEHKHNSPNLHRNPDGPYKWYSTHYAYATPNANPKINPYNRAMPAQTPNDWHFMHADGGHMFQSDQTGDSTRVDTGWVNGGYLGTSGEAAYINYTGVSGDNQNMPPYLKVYMWKRTG